VKILSIITLFFSINVWAYQDRDLVGHFNRLARCNLVENVNKADISLVKENGIGKVKIRFSGRDEVAAEVLLGRGNRDIVSTGSSHEKLDQKWNADISFGGIWATETVRDSSNVIRSYAIKKITVDAQLQVVTYYEGQYQGISAKPYFERECYLYR
jgi:hypothetical protein